MNNGSYDLEGVIWHQHSNKLMVEILKLWPDKEREIIDIGCGHNFYVTVLKYAGYKAFGLDAVDLRAGDMIQFDCTEPIKATFNRWDNKIVNVISLEVMEHLPSEKESGYLDNITSFGGEILMSCAIPGQAGHGHINNRTNEYVCEKMNERGYKLDHQRTHDLRNKISGDHCSWFMSTLLYFSPLK